MRITAMAHFDRHWHRPRRRNRAHQRVLGVPERERRQAVPRSGDLHHPEERCRGGGPGHCRPAAGGIPRAPGADAGWAWWRSGSSAAPSPSSSSSPACRLPASRAAVIHKTLFVWVALLAVVFLRERVGACRSARSGCSPVAHLMIEAARRRRVGSGERSSPRPRLLGGRDDPGPAPAGTVPAPVAAQRGWDWAGRAGRLSGPHRTRGRGRARPRRVGLGGGHRAAAGRVRRDLVRSSQAGARQRRDRRPRPARPSPLPCSGWSPAPPWARDRPLVTASSLPGRHDGQGRHLPPPPPGLGPGGLTSRRPALLPLAQPPGPVLFGRYAFRRTGSGVGPDASRATAEHAAAGTDDRAEGTCPGLRGRLPVPAAHRTGNGIEDPLGRAVVEAYWLGNGLTEAVGTRAFHRSAQDRFRRRLRPAPWRWLERSVADGARPVHAFHVLEFCRGSACCGAAGSTTCSPPSTAAASAGDGGIGHWRPAARPGVPLEQVDGRLRLAVPRPELIERWQDRTGFVDDVRPGDVVAIHWGWACDRLSGRQLRDSRAGPAGRSRLPTAPSRSGGSTSPRRRPPWHRSRQGGAWQFHLAIGSEAVDAELGDHRRGARAGPGRAGAPSG